MAINKNIIRFYFNYEGDYIPFNSIGGHGYPRKGTTSGDNPAILFIPPEGVKPGFYQLRIISGGFLRLYLTSAGVWVANPDFFPDRGFKEVNWETWEELI